MGALRRRAEQTFLSLSADARASLGRVLTHLVTVGEADGGPIARQRAPVATVAPDGPRRELVDRFVAGPGCWSATAGRTGRRWWPWPTRRC